MLDKYNITLFKLSCDKNKITKAPSLTVKTTEKANKITSQSNKSATSHDGGVSDGSNATKRS